MAAATGYLPTGTVTFLFTDVEGSTRLLQDVGEDAFRRCLRTHDEILRSSVGAGTVVKTMGDGFFVVFPDAFDALTAAVGAQRALEVASWPEGAAVRVRMGLHTGTAVLGGEDYLGLDVHRAARISDAGHGGQILLSEPTASIVGAMLPAGLVLEHLGSFRLKDLTRPESLYQVVVDGLPSRFPPLRTMDLVGGVLPVELSSFVGRNAELAAIGRLLADHRVVTLTGPGGTGKTRLAIRAAAEAVSRFPDGVFFVPLESISEPELVPGAILEAIGLHAGSSAPPLDRLGAYLERKQTLLVLDNLEQVLPAGAHIARLLGRAPGLAVLATSRGPLRISGEREFRVPPLALPDSHEESTDLIADSSGVQLFVERARAVDPGFELTDANAQTVAELVARLDALPLAIELAASRTRHLTLEAILERLSNRLLANRSPDLPARQQTMANAIGWSYELLDPSARVLFRRCSVFVGGARLSDIEAVCDLGDAGGFILDDLADLVDHGLIAIEQEGADARYRMLVVVREFALGALAESGDEDRIRERHARRFATLASDALPHLLTSGQRAWLDRLSTEHDNLRAALDWAASRGEGDLARRMVGDLWRFWQARGHLQEAGGQVDRALMLPGSHPRARAAALEAKGGVLYWRGEWAEALAPYQQALDLLRGGDDQRALANAWYNLSFPQGYSGDRDGARASLREALRISEDQGDRLGIGRAYWGLCDLALYERDHEATIAFAERAIEEFEHLDAPFDLGWAHFMIAQAHFYLGRPDEARVHVERGLSQFTSARDVPAIVLFLSLKAATILAQGDREAAARMIGVAEGLKQRSGAGIADVAENRYEPLVRLLTDPPPEIAAAFQEGCAVSEDEALLLASPD